MGSLFFFGEDLHFVVVITGLEGLICELEASMARPPLLERGVVVGVVVLRAHLKNGSSV